MRVMSKLRNMFSTRKCMQIAPETEMMHELTPEELYAYFLRMLKKAVPKLQVPPI